MSNKLVVIDFESLPVDTIIEDETAWFSQKQIAAVFEISVPAVNQHIKRLSEEEEPVIKRYLITGSDGKQYQVEHYNLDMLVEIGFAARKSAKAKAFRKKAMEILRTHFVKQVRVQEKAEYSKLRDLITYASDYDPSNPLCAEYFATVQNKVLYAATGNTAAELIVRRANADQQNMGLHTWAGNSITKQDAKTAKNYLNQDELENLTRIVTTIFAGAYFLMSQQVATMQEWINYIDEQIILFRLNLLKSKGQYSHQYAMEIAAREYGEFKQKLLQDKTP